jgi:hypothetical protein
VSPVAEAQRITDLFVLLGEDQSLLTEFERDPQGVLEASGLDDDAIATVLAGDSDAVRAAVEDEVASDPARRRLVVAPRMMAIMKPDEPEPKPPPPPPAPKPKHAAGG